MSFSYSRFGNKYLKSEIEKTDEMYHEELKKMYSKVKCADCPNEYASWATLKEDYLSVWIVLKYYVLIHQIK